MIQVISLFDDVNI